MLDQIISIVCQAGEIMLQGARELNQNDITGKPGASNFVTKYDVMVQHFLIDALSKVIPNCGFLCEEEAYSQGEVTDGYCFIIDPIDGTTNFICGYQHSAVSVGLAKDKKPYLGVVYNPFTKDLYWGVAGKGAYKNGIPLHLEDRSMSQGVIEFSNPPYNTALRQAAIELQNVVSYHTMDLRNLGCGCLSLCYIADGRNTLYYSPELCAWDYAAAQVILEEAGAITIKVDGTPVNYQKKGGVIAGLPTAVEEFLQLYRSMGA